MLLNNSEFGRHVSAHDLGRADKLFVVGCPSRLLPAAGTPAAIR